MNILNSLLDIFKSDDEQMADIMIKAKPKDKEILARTMFGEARGEGKEGMLAVGNVIMNRLKDGRSIYKATDKPELTGVENIIKKDKAFSVFNNPQSKDYINMMKPIEEMGTADKEAYKLALEISEGLLTGKLKDNTEGATLYYNPNNVVATPDWAKSWKTSKTKSIGNHDFYIEVK